MKKMFGILILLLVFSNCALANGNGLVGNGGFEMSVLNLDLGGLDAALATEGFALDDVVVMFGGGGSGGDKLGPRLGGFGAGGELKDENAAGDVATLGVGFGGFLYEHGLYYDGKMDVAVGGMFGGGGADLKIHYKEIDMYRKYEKGFMALMPRVNVHYQLNPVMGIECNLSYLFTYDFNQDWNIDGEVIDGPFRYFGGPRAGVRFTFGF